VNSLRISPEYARGTVVELNQISIEAVAAERYSSFPPVVGTTATSHGCQGTHDREMDVTEAE
jgi:hypothetical protein